METASPHNLEHSQLNRLEFVNSLEINYNDIDLSGDFTVYSEQSQPVDWSDFPYLSNANIAESASSKSSKKPNSKKESSNSGKSESHKAKSNNNSFGFVPDSPVNTDEESDEESSQQTKEESGQLTVCNKTFERDIKNKSCCLCLLL